ncbi:hypothetical protein BU25DRAFT_490114 [Macroventuria anomochaeta]|uniref:Uncharacterized protein n=1 Tax=Macroventuria anomochaeta TaxID=301207 RepID=A0ACB6S6Y0_9PLEO|nr:uncharacterized protein BU25DRAFT_490114 [Macroventuria anomochaeta]KAF2628974.1 hypothetical protein BU25DRAFT_490114 [Macroventuria anomochaeta]
MSAKNETTEGKATKKLLQEWCASLGQNKSKIESQKPQATDTKVSKQQRFKRYICIGRRGGREVQSMLNDPVIAQSAFVKGSDPDSSRTRIQHSIDLIFTSMTESDKLLQSLTNPSTQCFLVHLASDLNTQGSFLSKLHKLPTEATQLDEFASLSYASSWLQSSLILIRDSYSFGSAGLQMPFVPLETEYQPARARAKVLQRRYPGEQVVIATLDLVALRQAKRVASAEHAFKMLRVPMAGVDFSQRLLVWAEDGKTGGVVQGLRDAVLAVGEWTEKGNTDETEDAVGTKSKAVATEGVAEDGASGMGQSKSLDDWEAELGRFVGG